MLWAAVLHAEVRIEITQGWTRRALSAWYRSSGPARALRRKMSVVSWQLTCATAVNSIRWIALVCRSSRLVPRKCSLLPRSALGIDAVVVGRVTQNPDGSYQVAYQLVDTGGAPGTTLAQGSFKVTKQYLRYAAHAASDAVFEKLTGIKGAFRTRIAYVVQKNGGQYPYELRVSDYDGYNQFLVHRSSQPLMSPAPVSGRF